MANVLCIMYKESAETSIQCGNQEVNEGVRFTVFCLLGDLQTVGNRSLFISASMTRQINSLELIGMSMKKCNL